MKNRSFDDGLTYFFSKRIHNRDASNNILESLKPESEWDRTENAIEAILRWADDGGQMLDLGNLMAGSGPDTAREGADEWGMPEEKEDEQESFRKQRLNIS